jgi:hypothetical protein
MRVSKNYRPDDRPFPLDPPSDMPPLDAMAVVDAFADACERSEAPPLSEWLRRYPEYATALADYAAAMFSEPETGVTDTGAEQTYGELSPGTLRALDATFIGTPVTVPERPLLRVAEPPSSYNAHSRAAGILALAHARGLDLEQLAQAVDTRSNSCYGSTVHPFIEDSSLIGLYSGLPKRWVWMQSSSPRRLRLREIPPKERRHKEIAC